MRSLQSTQRANQLWQIEASLVDALCANGRSTVYACIDTHTRQSIGLVSQARESEAVALLLHRAIAAWGVPEAIATDNTSNLVAHETKQLMLSLGIDHQVSNAYSPQTKGHVERLMRTFPRGHKLD